ncbi:hypothetical protein ACIGNX_12715 [Actinosynnema sp. NPDC053489]|uniref:hypothetical protein n=1 Tax=Actinosynnema sp. NPDC053489 TaxID=3363916 RepID=UPI0037C717EB
MAFVTGRGGRAARFPNEDRTARHGTTQHDGIGWAMARMPWHGRGRPEQLRLVPDHQDIGRATWFVGRSDAQRVADTIGKVPARPGRAPHTGAAPAGSPGEAAPRSRTWRRRIAEEFVHQEGVSL